MNPKLDKNKKILLIITAILIASAWFLPLGIRLIRNSRQNASTKTEKRKLTSQEEALKVATDFLEELQLLKPSETKEKIGFEANILGYEIADTSFNSENVIIKAGLRINNSFLPVSILLKHGTVETEKMQETRETTETTEAEEKTDLEKQEGVKKESWTITEVKYEDYLQFYGWGINLSHSPNWQVQASEMSEDTMGEFMLVYENPETGETTETAIFIIEQLNQGEFIQNSICEREGIDNCQEIQIGENTYEKGTITAEGGDILRKALTDKNIYIILGTQEKYTNSETEVGFIFNSIKFE